ncbi:ABC transporter ATP-binding protein [Kitasatospora cineracea]|uniref:ABC transporter ATP-binding protein n=1 Tax=Kitasatospora cineracea TaxID=88074 RepID=UPI003689D377
MGARGGDGGDGRGGHGGVVGGGRGGAHGAGGQGEAEQGGGDRAGMSENALTKLRRDRIGFVFQSFNLIPALTARQNVELPLKLAGVRPDPAEVEKVLAGVNLTGRAGHLPSELSGGRQQRVAIARALVTRPEVLFADEPTGALDTRTSRDVLALLRRIVTENGQTIIMVTHDPVAASYADQVVFLADGRVVDRITGPTVEAVANRMARLEPEDATGLEGTPC